MTRPTLPLPERPHALYRFFGHNGQLLYLGITASLPSRLIGHRDDKPWWTDVADIKVEHYPDRPSVLAAERAAIRAERPLWNVIHNRNAERLTQKVRQRPDPSATREPVPAGCREWIFASRSGNVRIGPLWLYWEAEGDPISDNYYVEDISAEELWREWLTRLRLDEVTTNRYGPGRIPIAWFVTGSATFEAAPFQPAWQMPFGNFLDFYSWPLDANTGERLRWSALPIEAKVWRKTNVPDLSTTKGGFIPEATGWAPAPMQPYLDVVQMAWMAGLYVPDFGRARVAAG